MANKDPQLAFWRQLPDPRAGTTTNSATLGIVVLTSAWQHFRRHVISQEEPWEDWLTRPVWENVWYDEQEGIYATLARIEQGIRQAFEKPLVLRQQEVKFLDTAQESWILVLPAGVQAVILVRGGCAGYLQTCFYPEDAALDDNPAWRWRKARRWIVLRYTDDPTRKSARMPDPNNVFRIGAHEVTNFRYVTPASWGFTDDAPGASWRDPYEDWPEPPEPAAMKTPGLALDPRRDLLQDENHHG